MIAWLHSRSPPKAISLSLLPSSCAPSLANGCHSKKSFFVFCVRWAHNRRLAWRRLSMCWPQMPSGRNSSWNSSSSSSSSSWNSSSSSRCKWALWERARNSLTHFELKLEGPQLRDQRNLACQSSNRNFPKDNYQQSEGTTHENIRSFEARKGQKVHPNFAKSFFANCSWPCFLQPHHVSPIFCLVHLVFLPHAEPGPGHRRVLIKFCARQITLCIGFMDHSVHWLEAQPLQWIWQITYRFIWQIFVLDPYSVAPVRFS